MPVVVWIRQTLGLDLFPQGRHLVISGAEGLVEEAPQLGLEQFSGQLWVALLQGLSAAGVAGSVAEPPESLKKAQISPAGLSMVCTLR